jgi:gas vesicle protein
MCIGRFLTGFILGSAVGGVLGILLAPRSGEETRELILDKSEEVYKSTEDSLKEIHKKANHVIDDIQKKGDDLLGQIKELIKKEQA